MGPPKIDIKTPFPASLYQSDRKSTDIKPRFLLVLYQSAPDGVHVKAKLVTRNHKKANKKRNTFRQPPQGFSLRTSKESISFC